MKVDRKTGTHQRIPGRAAFIFAAIVIITCNLFAETSPSNPKKSDTSPSAGQSVAGQLQQRDPRYRLHKSDVIAVEFTFSPEFNESVTVQPDGYISLKGACDVKAENQTVAELKNTIRNAYRKILDDPVITITLKDFDKPFFLASGQVGKPGKYELRSDTTLTEALAIAGGFTQSAKHSQVVLFHRVSRDTVEARVYDVKSMLRSRNLAEDPHLVPGDMLYVPQSKWSKVRQYLPSSSMGLYANPSPF